MPQAEGRLSGVNSGPKEFEFEYCVQIAIRGRCGGLYAEAGLSHAGIDISTRRELVLEGWQLRGTDNVVPVRIYLPEVVAGVEHSEPVKADAVLFLRDFTFQRYSSSLGLSDNRLRGNGDHWFLWSGCLFPFGWTLSHSRGRGWALFVFERSDLAPDLAHHLIQLLKLVFELLDILLLPVLRLGRSRLNTNGGKSEQQYCSGANYFHKDSRSLEWLASAARYFWSAAGTLMQENKWKQLGKSLGMDPAAALPTLAVGRGTHQQRHERCQHAIVVSWLGGLQSGSQVLLKVDGGPGEMLILSLNWLGCRCPTTLEFPEVPPEGSQPGKMSTHVFPIGARRHPPTTDRWVSRWFKYYETSGHAQRGLSRQFAFTACPLERSTLRWLVVTVLGLVCFAPPSQAQERKQVLMINEVGQSHPGPVIVTNAIVLGLQSDPRFEEEFHWENLDAVDISDDSLNELRDSIIQKYRRYKLDLIVLLGPDPLRLLLDPSKPFYPDVPVVFCCTVPGQIDQEVADSRSTGSWFQLDPAKTLDAALRLLPETRQVFVVAGQSRYDRGLTALVKARINSDEPHLAVTYLTGYPMAALRERLRQLPSRSIVLYVSFFKDALGQRFLNATEALPLITAASSSPVFGISDTHLGHGIVGGFLVSVEGQGKIAARDALEILAGKPPQDIPIVHGPSFYQFDWRELQRWKLDQSKLPAGSAILFRQPTFWERNGPPLLTGLLIFSSFALLAVYLLFKQKQLKLARSEHNKLSGMLITAQEKERSRLAAEIHDDFSQRLALLALGLENAEEAIGTSPREAVKQVHNLLNSASEIGADLHTLSHRLHSSTLEALGLVPGVSALCKEFTNQQGIEIDFLPDDIPHFVQPDVALCLFRIVQEGLRNLKKHSGASKAQVRLCRTGDRLVVSVCDEGVGFDVRQLGEKEGLGIRSMEERAYLLGGRFEIHSVPGKGTRIEACVPLQPKSERAAG
jgi:signal transduction histidine kinase